MSLPELARRNPSSHGLALIISNDYEDTEKFLAGTEKDGERMKTAFERLGIATIWRHNVRWAELKELLRGAAQLDPRKTMFETISFFFAGHGDTKTIAMEDDPMDLQEVVKAFSPPKARWLGDIPKLFFIDACRGEDIITSYPAPAVHRGSCSRLQEPYPRPRIIFTPKEGNILMAFSTLPSYVARDSTNGSKWTELLADELCKSTEEINEVLRQVRSDFRDLQQDTAHVEGVQLPETRSTLCKRVILNKFKREPQHQLVRATPTYHMQHHSHYVPGYPPGFPRQQVVRASQAFCSVTSNGRTQTTGRLSVERHYRF